MKALIEPLHGLDSYIKLLEAVRKNKTPALCSGVIDSQKNHITYALMEDAAAPALIITESELAAKKVYEDMSFFTDGKAKYYPAKDMIFYAADVKSADIIKQRFEVLNLLLNGGCPAVVLSVEALFDRLSDRDVFQEHILELSPGIEFPTNELITKLVSMGYERSSLVEGPGQFAVRGGIVDIFTTIYDNAIRLEFWGDEIDSVRLLDAYSQRSIEKLDSVRIFPFTERLGGPDVSLLSYFPDDTVLFFDEPGRIAQHAENVFYEYSESIKNRILKGDVQPSLLNMVFSYAEILSMSRLFRTVLYTTLTHTIKDFALKENISIAGRSVGMFTKKLDILIDDLKYRVENKHKVIILAGSKFRGQRMAEEIREHKLPAVYQDIESMDARSGSIIITRGNLNHGFEYSFINLTIMTDNELFAGSKGKKTRRRAKGAKIESFTDLRVGDYVVHINHGIGIYKGIERIMVDNVGRDYLKLAYSDGGHLYVHTEQMDMIQKYIGGEGAHLKLNKLGGAEWARVKEKTKKAVSEMAKELVELYAKRQSAKGFAYGTDTVWQNEFEETFPYDETDDQLTAIEDVKRDMQSDKVMDRLICGDVGYGKTEVAIRAAFKAVQDGKQVAYLVPTTILAQQHYNTFVQRMKDFPIGIEHLSRFRTAKQQKESLRRMECGLADIVIGTHRILSADVKFKDLGLIIVDEEQRFGVGHKEKLKKLRENVDVITLTATPIPRTLHMSLTGIRDMSILEEPPHERQPIQTYVMEYSPEFVKDAINRELARNGQVYYLHNRVMNIMETAHKVSEIVPHANVAYAHGQMSERELENVMMDFIDGEIDVLVCTTIIETGLDIPNVNTIIIQDSDNMGLSQLYQLRGRVGRSNRLAYAYLMYKKDKVLNEIAEKRLQTIREFTEFGSGFKIAMRDLEIRGAGNVLGAEQHGYMDAVGYDMYCKLLGDAVQELKGEKPAEAFETSIDININAYIPGYFIEDEEQKLEIYKKIATISNDADYFDIQEEIEDRFGDLPKCVNNLLDIARCKSIANKKGISSIIQKPNCFIITFRPDAPVEPQGIAELVNANKTKLYFTVSATPYFTYRLTDDSIEQELANLQRMIDELKTI